MESQILRQTSSETRKTNLPTNQSVPLDSFVEDWRLPEAEIGVSIADEVQIAKPKPQPWWIRAWQLFLLLAALWYAFLGGRGLFSQFEHPIVLFFIVVVIAWTLYHYVLAPRFKWPHLPLG